MFNKQVQGKIIIMVIAVNDLTLTSSCRCLLTVCKDELQSEFDITDLGPMHWLLGIEDKRDHMAQKVTLSQRAYISSIIMHSTSRVHFMHSTSRVHHPSPHQWMLEPT